MFLCLYTCLPLFPLLGYKFQNPPPAADDTNCEAMLPYSTLHRSGQNYNWNICRLIVTGKNYFRWSEDRYNLKQIFILSKCEEKTRRYWVTFSKVYFFYFGPKLAVCRKSKEPLIHLFIHSFIH